MFSRVVCDVWLRFGEVDGEFESFLKRFVDYLTIVKRYRSVWSDRVMFSRLWLKFGEVDDEFELLLKRFLDYLTMIKYYRSVWSDRVFTFVIKIWKSWWRVWITFEMINWLFNDGYRSVWGDRVMFSRIVCDVVIKIRRSWEFESFLKRFVDYLTMILNDRVMFEEVDGGSLKCLLTQWLLRVTISFGVIIVRSLWSCD